MISFYGFLLTVTSCQVAMVDLLFPEVGEVCGGSLREHRLDVLTEKIKGLKSQSLEWLEICCL